MHYQMKVFLIGKCLIRLQNHLTHIVVRSHSIPPTVSFSVANSGLNLVQRQRWSSVMVIELRDFTCIPSLHYSIHLVIMSCCSIFAGMGKVRVRQLPVGMLKCVICKLHSRRLASNQRLFLAKLSFMASQWVPLWHCSLRQTHRLLQSS